MMSSRNEHLIRECRKRKPVTCRYCDDCNHSSGLKSLLRKHSPISSRPAPVNFSEHEKSHNEHLGDGCARYHHYESTRSCRDKSFSRSENESCRSTYNENKQRERSRRCSGTERTLPFEEKFQPRMHLSNVHGGAEEETKMFLCEECGLPFEREFSLQVHSLCVHDGRGSGNELIDRSECQLQLLKGDGVEKCFKCNECGAVIGTRWTFRRHLVTRHSEERPFLCAKCGQTYKRRDFLRAHFKRNHCIETIEPDDRIGTVRCKSENLSEQVQEIPSFSNQSDNFFKGWSITEDRNLEVKPSISELQPQLLKSVSTPVPPVHASSRRGVRKQIENGKLARRRSNSVDANDRRKSNVCPSCGASFGQYDQLIRHAKVCEKYASLSEKEIRKRKRRRREYGCSICGLHFSSASCMNAHLEKVHGTKFFFHMCERHSCRKKFHPQFTS